MTDVQALAREALEDAKRATPGPWERSCAEVVVFGDAWACIAGAHRLRPANGDSCAKPEPSSISSPTFEEELANAHFIAKARDYVPALAQSVLSLAARVGEMEKALRGIVSTWDDTTDGDCVDGEWRGSAAVFYADIERARAALAAPRETTKEVKDAS